MREHATLHVLHDLIWTRDSGHVPSSASHCWCLQRTVEWHVCRDELDEDRTRTRWHLWEHREPLNDGAVCTTWMRLSPSLVTSRCLSMKL